MRGLLRGVVRDHRLPGDYKSPAVQPATTAAFFKDFKRVQMTRMVLKNYIHFPNMYFFFFGVPLFVAYSLHRKRATGSYPQILQPAYYMYRGNQSLYGYQATGNANPDNFFDRMHNCWTSDPNCGLDVGPKRPWLDLKDPSKNLVKFQRDADENKYIKANGWRGY